MKIRLAQKSDYSAVKWLWQYSFGFSQPFLQWSLENMLSAMQLYISENDSDYSAIAGSIPMNIACSDKTVRASYLCGCTTSPEHRNKGIMRQMINVYLRQLAGDQIPLSLCIPFDYKTLERYGWRTSYMYKQYALSPEAVPPYTIKGKVKIFALAQQSIAVLSAIYNKFTKNKNGFSKRSHEEWRRILDDLTVNFGGSCAVYYDKNNQPSGYMLYIIHGEYMRVYEMAYTDKSAAESLYAFMKNHSSQIKEITVKASADDLMHLDFCDSRNAVSLCPFVSARITSVPTALAYLCEKAENEIKIQVIDRIVEDNNATFSITTSGVVKTDDTPDAVTDIGTLTQLFMGFISVDEAVNLNMLVGNADAVKCLFEKKNNYINMLII